MKYKGKQGNSYLFECEGEELDLGKIDYEWFVFKNLIIDKYFRVATSTSEYKDIYSAVSMMQILIDEGEV